MAESSASESESSWTLNFSDNHKSHWPPVKLNADGGSVSQLPCQQTPISIFSMEITRFTFRVLFFSGEDFDQEMRGLDACVQILHCLAWRSTTSIFPLEHVLPLLNV